MSNESSVHELNAIVDSKPLVEAKNALAKIYKDMGQQAIANDVMRARNKHRLLQLLWNAQLKADGLSTKMSAKDTAILLQKEDRVSRETHPAFNDDEHQDKVNAVLDILREYKGFSRIFSTARSAHVRIPLTDVKLETVTDVMAAELTEKLQALDFKVVISHTKSFHAKVPLWEE